MNTSVALQKYEESGGWVAITFLTIFVALIILMGYAGYTQREQARAECETLGGDFIAKPHGENLCVPKGQVITLSIR